MLGGAEVMGIDMRNQIPKAAMRATNNAMRGYIPHSGIVSAGAKIMAGHRQKPMKQQGIGRKQERPTLTEINRNGKTVWENRLKSWRGGRNDGC